MAVISKFMQLFDANMWLIGDFYPSCGIVLPITAVIIILGGYYLYRHITDYLVISVDDATKNHHWTSIKFTSRSWYCSICESLLINGLGAFCDCCGVCADPECIKKANKLHQCKATTSSAETRLHHWVKGNLPLDAICTVCKEDCALEHGLVDYRCCWCQRCAHEECLSKVPDICDFGSWKNMLVPPWCVQVARRKSGIHRHLLLKGVKDPGWENWSPLIVVANRKSGNNDASLILAEFRKYLNPAQVIDLADRPPAAALQWCVLLAPRPITVLAAGGDGTVAWVLTTAYMMDLEPKPIVGIIPLGTGNDLSRVLGWGKGAKADLPIDKMVNILKEARTTELDRWKIDVIHNRHLGIRFPMKTMYMYNYFSVGVDAQVTLDFHKTRQSRMYFFQHRMINKLLYLCFGTQQFVTADCKNLEQRVDVYLDGLKADLPELESIVVLNIPSWGAGVDLWNLNAEQSATQSYNDGIVEVLGIYSSFHIAQLQVGMSNAHRIGQARNVELHIKGQSPVQLDGEPWEQHPAIIKISAVDRATVLVNTKKKILNAF